MAVRIRFVGSGDSFGSGGRFQTCILVDGPGSRFAVDFGASSLIALAQQGIEHNSIDAIVLTHLHGDHAAGVPFLLIDAMLAARRTRPLTIAGPRELRALLDPIRETLFPGSHVMTPPFPLHWIDMSPGRPPPVLVRGATPRPAPRAGGAGGGPAAPGRWRRGRPGSAPRRRRGPRPSRGA